METEDRVLVVTDDPGARANLTASLETAGYRTAACLGPGAAECPRQRGLVCPLRERSEVAVVDLDCHPDAHVCHRIPADGGTVFVRRSDALPARKEAVLRAVRDARRHVQDLVAAPDDDVPPIAASDLD